MPVRVTVKPQLLNWARSRSSLSVADLRPRFPKLEEWESGALQPTLKQLEDFANATHTPIGMLFLSEPPSEPVPIPDFRTMANRAISRPSPNLLDTVYLCQQRQEWFRDFEKSSGAQPLSFVGSLSAADDVVQAANQMRQALDFSVESRRQYASWTEALRALREHAEDLGVLVMVSGVVGSNTHRALDPSEFRGFALADELAPVIFINGADTKAAQIFTLAHELAHVWLGQTALSNSTIDSTVGNAVERWCNRVAAEFLVPVLAIRGEYRPGGDLVEELERLARRFRVSTLVILRRIKDAGGALPAAYGDLYDAELRRVIALRPAGSGGDFYNTQPVRVSKKFARAVITSTLEGQTLYNEAFRLLGFKKQSTFQELAQSLGVL